MIRASLLLLCALAAACSGDGDGDPAAAVRLGPGGLLTDGEGRTLYLFADDLPGAADGSGAASRCAIPACVAWRPVAATGGEGVDAALVGRMVRPDGAPQATYRGWPLYTFDGDAAPGDRKGDGAEGVWFAVPEPFYDVLIGRDGALGSYLTTPEGRTLYWFGSDTPAFAGAPAQSSCTGSCAPVWPVFHAAGARLPSTLRAGDFGATAAGQTTYRGWPLYQFGGDNAPRETHGDGIASVWFVAPPSFVDLSLRQAAGGPLFLADAAGLPLYGSAGATCGAGCRFAPFDADPATVRLPSAVARDSITRIVRDDGAMQLAFAGEPLFRYLDEIGPGGAAGDGLDGFRLIAVKAAGY